MAEALPGAFHPGWPRVMPGSFQRIGSEHAGVPISHALFALGFINNVKAETSWAEEGASPTAQAAL